MITEYIYENQEYENVLVKIKAALMDIISSEENKLYEIEQKITTTTDESFKEKLKEFFKKLNPFKKKNVEKEAENTAEKAKDAAEEATKK